jgi:hypothetical protein
MFRWHPACTLLRQHTKLASRGGRNRTSTRDPVWGVNWKEGACTSPLFHFWLARKGGFQSVLFSLPNPAKKMSGRWGHRPLGRGDGGKCNLRLARYSTRVAELAISSATCRSNQNTKLLRNPAQLPTTFAILQSAQARVDSLAGSFRPVLTPHFMELASVPSYSRLSFSLFEHHSGMEGTSTGHLAHQLHDIPL